MKLPLSNEPRYQRFDIIVVTTDRYPAVPKGTRGMVKGGDDYYNLWMVAFDNGTGGQLHGTDMEKIGRVGETQHAQISNEPLTIEDYQGALQVLADELDQTQEMLDKSFMPRMPGKSTLVENLQLRTALRDLTFKIGPMTWELTCYWCGEEMEHPELGYEYEVQHKSDCPYSKAVVLLEKLGIRTLDDPVG